MEIAAIVTRTIMNSSQLKKSDQPKTSPQNNKTPNETSAFSLHIEAGRRIDLDSLDTIVYTH